MFRFFRHIRNKLIKENNIRTYLLYAVGEILLVVVGILIALQIDKANQYQQDREEEQAILAALLDDYQETIDRLKGTMRIQSHMLELTKRFYEHYQYDDITVSTDSIGIMLSNGALSFWRVEPVLGSYESLLGSGKTELLEDRELRRLLAEFHTEISAGFEDHQVSMDLITQLSIMAAPHHFYLSSQNRQNYIGISINKASDFTEDYRRRSVQQLMQDDAFFGLLYEKTNRERNRLNWQKTLLERCEVIVTLIEANIEEQ